MPKELRFYNTLKYEQHGNDWYRRQFRGGNEHLYFESTPGYIYHPFAAERIFAALPALKMIVVLREPVERAFSAWNHYRDMFDTGTYLERSRDSYRTESNKLYEALFLGRREFPGLEECIEIELDLMASGDAHEPGILRRGLYLEQLERYWQHFPRERILLIGFRSLISDPAKVLGQIAKFLSVDAGGWDRFDHEPRNIRDYTMALPETQGRFMRDFYAEPNRRLVEEIGEVDW